MNRIACLAALAVLVVNDHVLKHAFPGFVTGKLSDFAGVFVLAVFLAFFVPRKFACIAAGVLFVWWKSPLSQAFIDALPFEASRVVDWTDLFALVMLPAAYRVSPREVQAKPLVASLSVVAFVATSVPQFPVTIAENDSLRAVQTNRAVHELPAALKPCGIHLQTLDEPERVYVTWSNAMAFPEVEIVAGKAVLHFTEIDVRGQSYDEVKAERARADLRARLAQCLKK